MRTMSRLRVVSRVGSSSFTGCFFQSSSATLRPFKPSTRTTLVTGGCRGYSSSSSSSWRHSGRRRFTSSNGSSSSSSSATVRVGFFRRLFNAYNTQLERNPIITKGITSMFLFAAGDAVAQGFEHRSNWSAYDIPRLARAGAFGGLILGPLAHFHYMFLEWLVIKRLAIPATSAKMPLVKMFLEQFTYWAPSILAIYHASIGAMEGLSPSACWKRVEERWWTSLKANWVLWPAASLINFKFVPVAHQLNYTLVVSLGWAVYLSQLGAKSSTSKPVPVAVAPNVAALKDTTPPVANK